LEVKSLKLFPPKCTKCDFGSTKLTALSDTVVKFKEAPFNGEREESGREGGKKERGITLPTLKA